MDISISREYLAVAFDFDDLEPALRMGKELSEYAKTAKIGLELFSACGPKAVKEFRALGYDVFLDLKLYDIPNTLKNTGRVLKKLNVSYLTVHLSAGLEAIAAIVNEVGEDINILGVTVLTSKETEVSELLNLARLAQETRCFGIVCSAKDIGFIKEGLSKEGKEFNLKIVCPGIRPAGQDHDDQKRIATPGYAIGEGASLLVVGRPITQSANPKEAARGINEEILLNLA